MKRLRTHCVLLARLLPLESPNSIDNLSSPTPCWPSINLDAIVASLPSFSVFVLLLIENPKSSTLNQWFLSSTFSSRTPDWRLRSIRKSVLDFPTTGVLPTKQAIHSSLLNLVGAAHITGSVIRTPDIVEEGGTSIIQIGVTASKLGAYGKVVSYTLPTVAGWPSDRTTDRKQNDRGSREASGDLICGLVQRGRRSSFANRGGLWLCGFGSSASEWSAQFGGIA